MAHHPVMDGERDSVIVLGGAGYIGSHVCYALAKKSYLPVCYDNLSTGHAWAVKWGPSITADTGDPSAIRRVLDEYAPIGCIHLGAHIEVGESIQRPLKYYANNTANTVTVLNALQDSSVQAFVFSSTAAVYGEPQYSPIDEAHSCHPTNPYGWSKYFCEQVIRDQAAAGGVPSVILRYFNAAGATCEQDIGEDHADESHLIPNACLASLGAGPLLKLFGGDHPTEDGTAIRDYIHVMDLAHAHVQALEYLIGGGESIALNLGNGEGYSVREVIAAVNSIAADEVPYAMAPKRAGDVGCLVADSGLAKSVLDWEPEKPSLKEIVESAYKWHRKHHAGKS